jgi:hypothetical protein
VTIQPTGDDSEPSSDQSSSEENPGGAVERFPGELRSVENEGEVEQIASLVIARIENKLEHHLHTQMEMPSAEQAADLRDRAPEVYQAWIDIARQEADTKAYVQRAQYEVPERLAHTGRPWALVTLVIVLVFCGYIASLGGSGIYVAGIIAGLDLVAMMGLFFGFRPAPTSESERKEKELPSSDSDDSDDQLRAS